MVPFIWLSGLAITHFIKEERWHPPKLRWEDEEIGR
jgi:hypothetical protein